MSRTGSIAIAMAVILASLSYPLCVWLIAREAPAYSWLRDQISELGAMSSAYAWALGATLVVDALLLIGLASRQSSALRNDS